MRNSKNLASLLIIGLIFGILSVAAPSFAHAANVSGTGDLTAAVPNNGPVGQIVTLEAANGEYTTGDTILVTITGSASTDISGGTITVNSTGGFKGTATIPADATVAVDTITTTDAHTNAGSTPFTVFTSAIDAASPNSGPVGQGVAVNFNHFISGHTVALTIAGTGVTESPITTNSTGGFAGTVHVGAGTAAGVSTISATDGTNTQTTAFTVTAPAVDAASPNNGPIGQTVAINFNNFRADTTAAVTIGGTAVTESPITVNSTGGFSGTVHVAGGTPSGVSTVSVTDGTNTQTTPFTVFTSAIDAASPNSGPVGQGVAVNFNHFISGHTVALTIAGTGVTESPITTNSTGGFAGTVHVGAGTAAGVSTISATDGTNTQTTAFTVTAPAVDAASPNNGPIGQTVAINFNNFRADTTAAVTIGGTAVTESPITVNSTGGFSGTVHVAGGTPSGVSTVSVTDGTNTQTTPFTVFTSAIDAASPNSGPVGQGVAVNFNHFISGHTVALTIAGTGVTESPITTNSTGGFAGTVHVGAGTAAGVSTISATDGTNTQTTAFTVTAPAVDAASPNNGPIGQTVAINFNNFRADTTAAVTIGGTAVTESPITVNSTGGFSGTVHVAGGTPSGVSTVSVTDGTNTQTTPFTVFTSAIDAASPNSGPVGQGVAVNFNHFISGHTVALTIAGTGVTESPITTNSTGGFAGTVHVGAGTAAGVSTISATDGTNTQTTAFTVTAPAVDAASPNNGPIGQTVAINFNNFRADTTAAVTIGGTAVTESPITVNSTGGFSGTVHVAGGTPSGVSTVSVTDGTNTQTTPFTVFTSAIDAASPNSGPVGQGVAVNFNHFISGHTVALTIAGTGVTESPITTNSTGGFAGTVHVGAGTAAGVSTISATDGTNTQTTAFTVTAPAVDAASPNNGPIGQTVAINFNNFRADTTAAVTIGGTAVTESPITVNSTGGFSGTVHVAGGTPSGVSTVSVTDGTNTQTTPFTVFTSAIDAASPNSGPVGQGVAVNFNHFISGHTVALTIAGTGVTESPITTNSTGGFAGTVHVGAGTAAGVSTISATDGTNTQTTAFTVTAPAVDAASPNNGPIGQTVAINFNNFRADTTAAVTIGGTAVTESPITVNSTGGFSGTVHVAGGTPSGVSTVSVTDGTNTQTTPFTVFTSAIDAASPNSGPVGQGVAVNFNHFISGHTVALTIAGTGVTESPITTNSTGGFAGTVHVGAGTAAGVSTISATDGTNTQTTAFTVFTPTVTVFPSSGSNGTSVTIQGLHYITPSTVTAKIGSQTVGSISANTTGGFSSTFALASKSKVNANVNATDGTNTSPNTTFTITAPVTDAASPNNGPVGQPVAVNFNNFIAGHSVTINFGSTPISNSTVNTNSTGGWRGTVSVPVGTPTGSQPVTLSDGTSTITTAFTVFTPTVTVFPSSGSNGTSVTIQGLHYITPSTVTAKIGSQTVGSISANTTGGFSSTFALASKSKVNANVNATDGTNTSPNTTFTITAPVTDAASPNNGPVGQPVAVNFNNFIAGHSVTINFGSTPISNSTVNTNSTGGWRGTVSVPVGTPTGSQPVTLSDGTSTITTAFTVFTPTVTVFPSSGSNGTSVTIQGLHYITPSTVTAKIGSQTVGSISANTTGGFSSTFALASKSKVNANVNATDGTNTSPNTTFTITAPVTDAASPNNGPVGQPVAVNFNNFIAGHSVTINFGSTPISNSTVNTNSTGGWRGTVSVPVGTPTGSQPVTLSDGTSTITTAFTVFTPTVTVFPSSGSNGTSVTIQGLHYITPSTVTAKIGSQTVGSISANTTGGFSSTFALASKSKVNANVNATDGTNTSPNTTFTITAPVTDAASPNNGPVGQPVAVNFNNFIAGHSVTINFGSTPISNSTVNTNSTGGWRGTVSVPVGTPTGSQPVTLSDGTSTITTAFTVFTPTVTVFPSSGSNGTSVTIQGLHYITPSTVTAKIGSQTVGSISANTTGGFSSTFALASKSKVNANVNATDGTNTSPNTTFTITAPVTDAASPNNGPVGQPVAVNFNNFIAGHSVTINFGSTPISNSTVNTNSTGGWRGTVSVPVGTPTGSQPVTLSDGTSTITTAFTVFTPTVTVFPSSGSNGTSVTIQGLHYITPSTVTAKIGSQTVGSISANTTGGFSSTFALASKSKVNANVNATDGTNTSPNTTFTITSPILNAASPTSGPVGQPVIISVNNLIASHAYTVKFGATLAFSGTTNTTGGDTHTVTVPTGATNTITVSDGTNSPTTPFTVTTRVTSTASPTSGPMGQPVAISFNNFIASHALVVTIAGTPVTESPIATNTTGGFSGTIHVASGTLSGVSTISATDGNDTTTTPFTVTAAAINVASPLKGPVGQPVVVSFNNLIATHAYTIKIGTVTAATGTTNSTGGFNGTVTVPTGATTGVGVVNATDNVSNFATTAFTVTVRATSTASPNNGPTYQPVAISFNNFIGSHALVVTIAGTPVTESPIATNTTGGFSGTIHVASGTLSGVSTISATDGNGTTTTPFTVTTRVINSVSPIQGPVGQPIALAFNHVISGTPVNVSIAGTPVTESPVTVNSTGGFSGTVHVGANTTAGLSTIFVSDGQVPITSPFTVTTPVINSVSPIFGPVGENVTIAFNNFISSTSTSIKFGTTSISNSTVTTNSTGGWTGSVLVPSSPSDTIHINDGTNDVNSTFTISSPVVGPAVPVSGPTFQNGTISGNHFKANHVITFTINEGTSVTTTPSTVTSNITGGFSGVKFTIPGGIPSGSQPIQASDGSNNPTTPFTVTVPFINDPVPASGPNGTSVLVSFNNLVANSSPTIKFGLSSISNSTVNTNSSGGWTGTVIVPGPNPGDNVNVDDGYGNTLAGTYTVTFSADSISPTQGPTKTPVTVSGTDFIANHSITFTFNGASVSPTSPVTSGGIGNFTATIIVPSSATAGNTTITASDSVNTKTQTFTVTSPTISYNPTGGPSGTTITATGLHFVPSFPITIKYDTTTVKTTTTNTTGGFVTTFVVPGSSIGSHNIITSDNATHSITTPTSVTTAITLSPTSGPNGTTVTVTGTNLIPSQTIAITYNGTTVTTNPATVTSTGTGSFTAKFNVPSSPAGGATVQASDGTNSPAAGFTVTTPAIGVNPSSNLVAGQSFTVTGTSLVPSHTITFKLNGVSITSTPATVTSNSSGGFTATLKVPASPEEFNTVTASDGTNSPTATFTVGASSSITSVTEGTSVGKTVIVNGTSFIPSHAITFKIGTTTLVTNPATVTSNATGSFNGVTFTVPTGTTSGNKTITASDGTNPATLTILINAGITLAPSTGPNGTQVTVTGTNLVPNHTITVRVNEGTAVTIPPTVTSSPTGGFSAKVTVQGITSSTTSIDAADGTNDPFLTFVMQTPHVSITPSTGNAGQTVTISGNHLVASHAITFKVGATTVTTTPATVTSNSTGGFSGVTLKISGTSVTGANSVTANDGTNSPFDTFTIGSSPSITLSPSTGNVGQTISVSGLNLAPSTKVTLKFGTTVLVTIPATITTNSTGGFTGVTFKVPAALASTVTVTGSDGTNSPTDSLIVSPFITFSPSSGPNGTQVTITGTSFGATQPVLLLYNGTALTTTPSSITTTAAGAFTGKFTVTNFLTGTNTIQAVDTSNSASLGFTGISPTLSVSPSSGALGQTITTSGNHFIASHAVTFKFNGVTLVTTPAAVTSNSTGGFTGVTFKVPGTAGGSNIVQASDGTNTLSTLFSVSTTPTITLDSSTGFVGKTVTITGVNLVPATKVTFKIGTTTLVTSPATVTSNSTGGFIATFVVPTSTTGLKTIIASDGTNNPTSPLTISSGLVLSPSSGPNGTKVTISGTNFAASKVFTFTFNGTSVTTTPVKTTSTAAGAITGSTFVIGAPSGLNILLANDTAATNATFTVTTSGISLSPSSGVLGQTVTITGTNFVPTHAITFKLNGTTLAPTTPAAVTSSATGAFSATFKVPATAKALNTITASDLTNTPNQNFTISVTPGITLNSTTNIVGSPISVSGLNFVPATKVTFKFGTTALVTIPATVTSNSTGGFTGVIFKVPATVAPADVSVNATDGINKPSTTFTVIAGLTTSPVSGPNGTQVTFSGTSFTANKAFTFTFAGNPVVTTPTLIKATATGTLTGKFTVAAISEGTTLVANDTASTSANFDVTTSGISLSPSSGVLGQTVTITGTNFVPTHAITFKLNGTTLAPTTPAAVTSSATGAFSATFKVPATAKALNTITASDLTNTPNQNFTIGTTPAITLNFTSGIVGKTISVSGLNFVPATKVTFKFGTATLVTIPATVTSNSTGGFSGVTFKVPASAGGATTVSASDNTNTPSTAFTVTSGIKLSPTSGPNGTKVTITGTSFAASKVFTFTFNGTSVTTTPVKTTSTAAGAITGSTFVIGAPSGLNILLANDTAATNATFTVTTSGISLSPSSGVLGQTVTITGTNFVPTHAITFKLNGTTLAPTTPAAVTSSATGAFSVTFKVPATAGGHSIILASDATNSPTAVFTIGTTPAASLLTSTGPAGTALSISGSNLTPSTKVTIKFDTKVLTTTPATVTTDSFGAFTAIAQVPVPSTGGSHTITISDGSNNPTTSFAVTSGIKLSPTSGPNGTKVTITGTSFAASKVFTFTFNGTSVTTTPVKTTSTATGAITGSTFVVTNSPAGLATFLTNDTAATHTTFTVTTSGISLSPSSGVKGQTVTITGTNFVPTHTITFKLNGTTLAPTTPAAVTSSATGTFSATFKVPATAKALNTITASDLTNTPNQNFTIGVTPGITLNSTTNIVGSPISVSGLNFVPATKVTFKIGTTALVTIPATVTSNSTGGFSGVTFKVPATVSGGATTVSASDSINTPSTSFTVIAGLTVSPVSGPNGTQVTFTGTSFTANKAFTFTFAGNPVVTTPTLIKSTATGTLTGKFTVAAISEGTSLVANDTASTSANFNVVTAGISLSPSSGVKGQTVTITGTGFIPSHIPTFKLNGTTLTPISTTLSSSGFTSTFKVPATAGGHSVILASDATNSATAVFTIGVTPGITLNSTTNIVGKTISVSGLNFVPATKVTFKIGTTALVTIPATVTSNSTGGFSGVTFKVPATVSGGATTVSASDSINTPSTSFTVIAGLTVSPVSGPNGTQVTFTGTSFTANKAFTFTFAGNPVVTTPTLIKSTATGTLTGKFTVAAISEGTSLVANDTASTSANFNVVTAGISLSPSSGVKGQTVTITGTNFVPTHAITFKLNGTTLAPTTPAAVTSSATGTFSATFKVPATAKALNTITASDLTNTPNQNFTIGVTPGITLNSTTNIVGSPISVSGLNFVPATKVTFKIGTTALVTIPATVTSNSTGGFTGVTFKVPATVSGGATTVSASDSINTPSTSFTVIAGLTVSPVSGPNGTQVTFTGTSFTANKAFTFTFAGNPVVTTPTLIKSTATGTLTGKFTVAAISEGTSLVANDTASTSANFNVVTAGISLSPSSGVKGQTVTITGTNFVPTHAITFKLNGTTLAPTTPAAVTSSATGTFSATFKVPATAKALNTITASDLTNTPNQNFTIGVTPGITLNSTTNIVGKTISAAGSSFVPSTKLTFKIGTTTLVTIPATVTTDGSGSFDGVTFKVPLTLFAGDTAVSVSDGTNTPSTVFTVIAQITLVPTSGSNGTTVTVSGTSFAASHTITFKFNGTSLTTTPATVTSMATGALPAGVKFTIPGSPTGVGIVNATDGTHFASTSFTVTAPSVTLSTGIAKPNQLVTVTGLHFVPTHAITIKFDGTTPIVNPSSISSTASGAVTAAFIVPASASLGTVHTVTISDGSSTVSKDLAVSLTSIAIVEESNSRVTIFPVLNSDGANATIAIGQPDLVTGDSDTTQNSLHAPSGGLALDSSGNMWVADSDNNRILEFKKPFSTSESASFVIGQTDFTSSSSGVSHFNFPHSIAFDSSGNLWVADQGNNRVLEFAAASLTGSNGPSPIHVIGQTDFTSSSSGRNSTNLKNPDSLIFDSSGNLWVGDGASSGAHGRVLKFPAAALGINHPSATFVLGQPSFTSNISGIVNSTLIGKAGINMAFDSSGNLWVPDPSNDRVLEFPAANLTGSNGPAATFVIGQTDFVSSDSGTTDSNMDHPNAVSFDSSGNLFVTDNHNYRVLEFSAASLTGSNGPSAIHVIGQKDFTSSGSGTAADKLYYPGTTRLLPN